MTFSSFLKKLFAGASYGGYVVRGGRHRWIASWTCSYCGEVNSCPRRHTGEHCKRCASDQEDSITYWANHPFVQPDEKTPSQIREAIKIHKAKRVEKVQEMLRQGKARVMTPEESIASVKYKYSRNPRYTTSGFKVEDVQIASITYGIPSRTIQKVAVQRNITPEEAAKYLSDLKKGTVP